VASDETGAATANSHTFHKNNLSGLLHKDVNPFTS